VTIDDADTIGSPGPLLYSILVGEREDLLFSRWIIPIFGGEALMCICSKTCRCRSLLHLQSATII
jgi:hypothetical protein